MFKSFTIIGFFISIVGLAQNNENCQTLLIDKDTPKIILLFSKDSTKVSLGIYKQEFETQTARDEYLKKFKKSKVPPLQGPESFTLNFAGRKPEKLLQLPGNTMYDVEKFREQIDYSKELYLIYKINNEQFLRWRIVPILEK